MKEFCHGKNIALDVYCVQKTDFKRAGGNSFGNLLFSTLDQDQRRQLLKIMKLTVILLLGAFLQASAHAYAQGSVTLSEKDAPLEKVIKSIEKQTGYTFIYESQLRNVIKRVTIEVKNAPITQVLEICFKDQPVSYKFIDKTIIVTQQPKKLQQMNEATEQNKPGEIKGSVITRKGEPIPGATIRIEGSNISAMTNGAGEFTIASPSESSVLIISSIGFETKTIRITSTGFLNIVLEIKINALDEAVIIAYGKTTRKFNTGNITSIKAEEIARQPISNPLLALQGRVPGLYITQNTGVANGSVTVRVQGQNSIMNGNDPLIIVDGVPYLSNFPITTFAGPTTGNSGAQGNPLSFINPSDIESIEILKDADATAIYGSRGANGVILITSKKGKPGKTKFEFRAQTGWGQVPKKIDVLNTRQYLDMRYEAFKNDGIDWRAANVSANDLKIWDTSKYTDWQKELIGNNASFTNINASISSGSDQFQYLISGSYQKETSVFPGKFADQKGTLHLGLNGADKKNKFTFSFTGNYMLDDNKLPGTDLTYTALTLEPNAPQPFTEEGKINWALDQNGSATWDNPLVSNQLRDYQNKTINFINNLNLAYVVIPGLTFTGNFGFRYLSTNIFLPTPLESIRPEQRLILTRSSSRSLINYSSWIVEPMIKYEKTFNAIAIDLLLGSTLQSDINESQNTTASGFTSDAQLSNMSAASSYTITSINTNYKYSALFSRLNVRLKDKYLINLTARRDGSSRFGENNSFSNFGSIGLGWIFTNEKILSSGSILNFGKIRGSYGTTGSDQIGEYNRFTSYITTTSGIPYQNTVGFKPSSHFNPYLQWEQTKKLQIGIDLEFFKGIVNFEGTFAKNQSTNQLIQYTLPTTTGFASILSNFPAKIVNKNWEFSIRTINLSRGLLKWNSGLNITFPKNVVASFPEIELTTYASGRSGVAIGQPLGAIKVLKYLGVNPEDGSYSVANKDGNPIISGSPTNDDYTSYINPFPKYYGGIKNNLSYKGIELDFLFQFVKQNAPRTFYYYNGNRTPGNFAAGRSNQPITVLNRWQDKGENAEIARYTTKTLTTWPAFSDIYYSYDCSFIRLKNVSIAWTLPNKLTNKTISNGRVFIQGQNILTISKFPGLNPESPTGNQIFLPALRVITIGFQASL